MNRGKITRSERERLAALERKLADVQLTPEQQLALPDELLKVLREGEAWVRQLERGRS